MENQIRDIPSREDELLLELADQLGNVLELDYDEKEAIKVFEEVGKVTGAMELFRVIMARDIKLYFQAQNDTDRAQIKGAYSRVAWLRGMIKKINEKKELDSRVAKRHA